VVDSIYKGGDSSAEQQNSFVTNATCLLRKPSRASVMRPKKAPRLTEANSFLMNKKGKWRLRQPFQRNILEGAIGQSSAYSDRQNVCFELAYCYVDWVCVFFCINQDWGSHRDLQCACTDDSCFLEASNFWWSNIHCFFYHSTSFLACHPYRAFRPYRLRLPVASEEAASLRLRSHRQSLGSGLLLQLRI